MTTPDLDALSLAARAAGLDTYPARRAALLAAIVATLEEDTRFWGL